MRKNTVGFFISFEGIDGAGKSTHIAWFSELLKKRYPEKKVILTREPGGTELGESLRSELLHREMHIETESLLMFAARREHLAQVIEPEINNGNIVISDRFTDASFAYQVGGRGLPKSKLEKLEKWVQERDVGGIKYLIQPNLTILFDLPGDIAEQRRSLARTPDKFEKLDTVFFESVRQEYLRRAKEEPTRFIVIDSQKSINEIQLILHKICSDVSI
jgi:dTMP kinase